MAALTVYLFKTRVFIMSLGSLFVGAVCFLFWMLFGAFGAMIFNISFLAIPFMDAIQNRLPCWPRFWEIFRYILPKRIREKVYEPGHNELFDDYLLTRRRFRTKLARVCLNFCLQSVQFS